MTLEDVLERIAQFYPEHLTEDEQQDFCEWWRTLDDDLQMEARWKSPMDAMVADVAAYDRRTAYNLMYNAHSGYLHYRRECLKLQGRVAGLENVNRLLNRELDRRFEK